MPMPLTCPQGHRWEVTAAEDGPLTCPLCGAAPLNRPGGAAESTTLPPQAVPPVVDVSVKLTLVPAAMLVASAVKSTVEVATTVTPIVAVLEPYRFVACMVTR